jgi:hypothetical protein
MRLITISFWRALVACVAPSTIMVSLLPLVLLVYATLVAVNYFWIPALAQVNLWLGKTSFMVSAWSWLEVVGAGRLKVVLGALVLIFAITPLAVVLVLCVLALSTNPFMVRLIARRHFAHLESLHKASWWARTQWTVGSVFLALLALVVSVPLWAIPPLVMLLPPLIWGWLTYRVMAFNALAQHATRSERIQIFKQHRIALFSIGVLCGALAAAPSWLWVASPNYTAAFVFWAPVAVWAYSFVFTLASLWFANYGLAALQTLRMQSGMIAVATDLDPVGT